MSSPTQGIYSVDLPATANNLVESGDAVGTEMHNLIAELYPICRSITGDGVRHTLRVLSERIPLEIHEVPTGTRVFDWEVPKEWNIRDAYIKNGHGERIVDFQECNLHVVNYSTSVHERLSLQDLRKHLHSIPEQPDYIPYRTSYYEESWGFCVPHRQLVGMEDDIYEVRIESTLEDGFLTYGELAVPGEVPDEVLISCHICHPSLCNDNLSGIALSTYLIDYVRSRPRHLSYRFLFIPATIGSITWLSRSEHLLDRIRSGLVVSNVGDGGPLHYKRSRRGDAEIDRVVEHVLRHGGIDHRIIDFVPYGYDERQYCSPAFNLPVGSLTRTPFGQYPEYHTSADNLDFVHPWALEESLAIYTAVVDVLEGNRSYLNLNPKCEPQLGRRGLYESLGGQSDRKQRQLAMLWVLNLSDGYHSLLEIAERADLPFPTVRGAADALIEGGLLKEIAA